MFTRSSGVLAHPTSFPSPYGIGDIGNYTFTFLDYLHKSKQKLWQILPLSTTSFGDSPYQSFSTFAGNPLLISPDSLIEDGLLLKEQCVETFSDDIVEYEKVINFKTKIFKIAYKNFCQKGDLNDFENFCNENQQWLEDFSLFVALKEHFIKERKENFNEVEYLDFKKQNETTLTEEQINDNYYGAVWNSWPNGIAKRRVTSINKWQKQLDEEIKYHKFLQYIFFKQWDKVKSYANSLNIQIIGDIPIFVSIDSADCWTNSKLFLLDKDGYQTEVAGVPPDYFSETGQLWGNPLYDYKALKKTKYKWWIDRVRSALNMYDIIRIDHFRGFSEYWSIPYGEKTAINGQWVKAPGFELFGTIKEQLGELPIIAEDLGVLTKDVELLRDSFNLPGMKILQFAFDSSEENDYLPHNFKNSNCVVYTGTHDNDTTKGWYEKASEVDKDNFRKYLNVSGENVAWDLIRLAFSTTAVFAIIPVQDLMSLDSTGRMNVPGVASGNWQYRFKAEQLTDGIRDGLIYLTDLFDR